MSEVGRTANSKRGFTLIEALVVIAIIAILAAILFPVVNNAKRAAKKDSDQVHMASIGQALKLYHNDYGAYPPLLLQAAEYNGTMLRRVYDLQRAFLYRARIKDINEFSSSISDEKGDVFVGACWPNRDPRSNPGNPSDYQAGTPADLVTYNHLGIDSLSLNGQNPTQTAQLYAFDNYDLEPSLNPGCATPPGQGKKYELRYIRFWTVMGQGGGGPTDNPRQLGYPDPRDDAIVTWNTYFQSTSGTPALPTHRDKGTLVLYVNGSVKPLDGRDVYERSWRFGQ